MEENFELQRDKIIGLGENSFKKSYYPELQSKIFELETGYLNLTNAFNSINDSLVIHDVSGIIHFINKQAEKFFNINDSELTNLSLFDLILPDADINTLKDVFEIVYNGEPKIVNLICKPTNSEERINVQVSLNKVFWYGKNLLISVIRDFSERIKFEKELIKAKTKAEESDNLKTSFLQNLSHEIRTPLNAINGFSVLLNKPEYNEEEKRNFTNIIHKSSEQLLNIVSDVLTISGLETNQEKIDTTTVSVNKLLMELIEQYELKATNKNITVSASFALSDRNAEIHIDKNKLNQILSNLISNAIKFTNKGFVKVDYHLEDNKLLFAVSDTGIGIKNEAQNYIFERFRQADSSIQFEYGGIGLGLSIAKAFVELLGGKIWVQSELEKGSTFFFTIPYKPVYNIDIKKAKVIKEKDNRIILIAEDEEINYLYLELILKKLNFIILHAWNGKEAFEICEKNNKIGLVLMDIKMPLIDGHSAAKMIRKVYPEIPIIAQSAYVLQNDRQSYSDVFTEFLTKPIAMPVLTKTVLKYFN
ncbi:MAG TPA: ATP-binding protein [Melioribacteraceae bacterium]|nr:ATP-binding protein [Melioribacteraceae bacterium]